MKKIAVIVLIVAAGWLWHTFKDEAGSKDPDVVLFNPDSPASVPHLFLPAGNSGDQEPQSAWRDYQLGTNAYRAKFTYYENKYMVDQLDPKVPRRYLAGVAVFRASHGPHGPVLAAVGSEFNGFYDKTKIGYWGAFDSVDTPEHAIKAMIEKAEKAVQDASPGTQATSAPR